MRSRVSKRIAYTTAFLFAAVLASAADVRAPSFKIPPGPLATEAKPPGN
jgi:hypothetical protein